MLKSVLKRAARSAGVEIKRSKRAEFTLPVEFGDADRRIFDHIRGNGLTMGSPERLIATINACKHACLAGIDGDFVECGVWRGGHALAAKMVFEHYGSTKTVHLFDTFAGMSAPTEEDKAAGSDEAAESKFRERQKGDHNDWCYASLEDVQANFRQAGVDLSGVRFVKGDVVDTLAEPANLPATLSVLRLDTDWYASTKAELEILYPRLTLGGSLLIDDFGHWEGARKAVEEYFAAQPASHRPLLHYTDYTGRMGVKLV